MKIICWFSCGVTSAVACKKAIDKFGLENCDIVYIHIDSAHEDNKRFISDCEKWYGKEIKVIKSDKYKNQFEIALDKKFINSPSGSPCTFNLKKQVRLSYEKLGFDFQVFGFEYSKKEINRAVRFKEQYNETKPIFPLIENKLTKNDCMKILQSENIEIPVMYKLGYSNNNCIGCFKGGAGYWNKIRKDFPNVFSKVAKIEREINASCLKGKFLDELEPTCGNQKNIEIPDCSINCEIEFKDILSYQTKLILKDLLNINEDVYVKNEQMRLF
jgi:hypothetical protein